MSKRDDISVMKAELNNQKMDVRKAAVKKVIGSMTLGKDVSSLFTDVLKCVETEDLELKKLVYLYIINYAKTKPDLALMAINTFRKDSTERVNPLIRSLAVRTMGCIGIEQMLEYLTGPLQDAMNDEDAYVRKTAALCVSKVFEINPGKIEQLGLLTKLSDMLLDGNGMVVSNATSAIAEIQTTKGLWFAITPQKVHALLNAVPETGDWGRIQILDFLAMNVPSVEFTDEHIQRIIPHLAHTNPAVVLSAAKIVLMYLQHLDSLSDRARSVTRKLAPPLISLMNNEPEIQYVAIKNINLILQRWPAIFDKEVRVFFCSFQDPLYIKLAKLDLLVRLADLRNIDTLLAEFKEYSQEIDIVFARKAITAVGRIAVKLEDAAERCVLAFHELIRTKVAAQYIVEEIVIVIKDIFRQYPNRFESIIKDLCQHLKSLDNADARAAMVWIIGEYGQRIENSIELMLHFSDNFKDEAKQVQMAILTASVKLYLKLEEAAEELVTQILKVATDESDNPDLRNRGYIYWRMLSEDPEQAKRIILCERPPIQHDVDSLDPQMRDQLLGSLSKLSSVYYKLPEQFVKKIRDSQNQKEEQEIVDVGDLLGQNEVYQVDSVGMKRTEYEQNAPQVDYTQYAMGSGQLLDLLDDQPKAQPTQDILADILGNNNMQTNSSTSSQAPLIDGGLLDTFSGGSEQTFIKVPMKPVLQGQTSGVEKKVSGLQISAAIQRKSQNDNRCILEMEITNLTQVPITNFLMKLNQNYLGLQITGDFPKIQVMPGQTTTVVLNCLNNGPKVEPPTKPPALIQTGLMCSLDLFYFDIPVLQQVGFSKCDGSGQSMNLNAPLVHTLPKMSPQITNPQQLIKRMSDHNLALIGQVDKSFFFCTRIDDRMLKCQIEIQPPTAVLIKAACANQNENALFIQALQFILIN